MYLIALLADLFKTSFGIKRFGLDF